MRQVKIANKKKQKEDEMTVHVVDTIEKKTQYSIRQLKDKVNECISNQELWKAKEDEWQSILDESLNKLRND